LLVRDLQDHPVRPQLMMPNSAKGGGRNRSQKKTERYSVPITVALSTKLKAAAAGRAGDAPLLPQSNGSPWDKNPGQNYHRQVDKVVTAIGLDPADVTMYALRHSSNVRLWEPLASLVLEAAYEATMLCGALNAARGRSNKVLLTALGGGAFGNDDRWIQDAITRALQIVKDIDLDVRLVSFRQPPRASKPLQSWTELDPAALQVRAESACAFGFQTGRVADRSWFRRELCDCYLRGRQFHNKPARDLKSWHS
jgi:hypothetical protein